MESSGLCYLLATELRSKVRIKHVIEFTTKGASGAAGRRSPFRLSRLVSNLCTTLRDVCLIFCNVAYGNIHLHERPLLLNNAAISESGFNYDLNLGSFCLFLTPRTNIAGVRSGTMLGITVDRRDMPSLSKIFPTPALSYRMVRMYP